MTLKACLQQRPRGIGRLTHRGLRAVCIAGRHPQTGALAEWHRASDTLENLDPQALLRAEAFTLALLRRIDESGG